MNLYQINQEVADAMRIDDKEEREYLLSQLNLQLEDQVEEMTKDVINSESRAVAIDDEIKRLSDRKKAELQHAESVKGYIKSAMERQGLKKAKFVNFTVSVAKTPAKVVVDNEQLVPAKYWVEKTTNSIDKKSLKEALKEGEVEGAKLESGTTLRVK